MTLTYLCASAETIDVRNDAEDLLEIEQGFGGRVTPRLVSVLATSERVNRFQHHMEFNSEFYNTIVHSKLLLHQKLKGAPKQSYIIELAMS